MIQRFKDLIVHQEFVESQGLPYEDGGSWNFDPLKSDFFK
jgi:hypothetical protein